MCHVTVRQMFQEINCTSSLSWNQQFLHWLDESTDIIHLGKQLECKINDLPYSEGVIQCICTYKNIYVYIYMCVCIFNRNLFFFFSFKLQIFIFFYFLMLSMMSDACAHTMQLVSKQFSNPDCERGHSPLHTTAQENALCLQNGIIPLPFL